MPRTRSKQGIEKNLELGSPQDLVKKKVNSYGKNMGGWMLSDITSLDSLHHDRLVTG